MFIYQAKPALNQLKTAVAKQSDSVDNLELVVPHQFRDETGSPDKNLDGSDIHGEAGSSDDDLAERRDSSLDGDELQLESEGSADERVEESGRRKSKKRSRGLDDGFFKLDEVRLVELQHWFVAVLSSLIVSTAF